VLNYHDSRAPGQEQSEILPRLDCIALSCFDLLVRFGMSPCVLGQVVGQLVG
jgi:hypothetical protein